MDKDYLEPWLLKNRRLTKNFLLGELIESDVADRLGIDNTPSQEIIANLKTLCETVLQPLRDVVGVIEVSSGYRCAELNKAVGSNAYSSHIDGLAADIVGRYSTNIDIARWLSKNIKDFDQVILEYGTYTEPSWIHIGIGPKKRREVLRQLTNGVFTVVKF